MKALGGETLDRGSIVAVLGAAFLWPCLQSSGFYPLSLVPDIGTAGALTTARYHMLYSLILIVLIGIAFVVRRRIEPILDCGKTLPFVIGLLGTIGQALLLASTSRSESQTLLYGGMALVAAFIVFFIPFWSCKVSKGSPRRVVLIAVLSYLLSQMLSAAFYATGLQPGYYLVACAALSAVCALFCEPNAEDSLLYDARSLKTLNWSMAAPALFLVYFCIIFIRVLSGQSSGDADISYKMIAAIISALAFAVVLAICLGKKTAFQNKLVAIFAFLVVLYIVSLACMLLLSGHENASVRRVLIASEHCFEAFIWMLLMYSANRNQLSRTLVFTLYTLVVVAIPWMLSYDLYHLSGLYDIVSGSEVLVPAVTIASLVAAVSAIAFLLSYSFKLGKESVQQKDAWRKKMLENALVGVKPGSREFEVAELLYRGYSAKKIADTLYVSEPTVKRYTSQLYRRYDIHSKQEFISYVDSFGEGVLEL